MASALPQIEGVTRFRLIRELGEGGMGVVYEAFDKDRKIPVALKTLRRASPAMLYLFKQEFRSIADIAHPNLIALYELFASSDEWFFTMQLLQGVTLLDFVRAGCASAAYDPCPTQVSEPESPATLLSHSPDPFATVTTPAYFPTKISQETLRVPLKKASAPTTERVRKIFRQVAVGIAALHRAGKLHRDIKPSNVMVTADGQAKVLDFGLAIDECAVRDAHRSNIVGTFAYMAPEQATGKPVTAASDWYAVGVMLYQALCGELPFAGYAEQMTAAKLGDIFLAPSEVAEDIDPELEQLTIDLLAADPALRPDEASILARLSGGSSTELEVEPDRRVSIPFYGRHKEQALLNEAMRVSLDSFASFALVHGASGVGKSSLVQHYLSALTGEALVLRGRCYEQESVPYKAIDSAVDAMCQHLLRLPQRELVEILPPGVSMLSQLFPVLSRLSERVELPPSADGPSDMRRIRHKAVAALRELLMRLRTRAPLILVMDDLQWGDVDSIGLLSEIFAPPDPPAILVLCTYRREYVSSSSCLTALFAMREANSSVTWFDVAIEPFSSEETQKFALKLLGQVPEQSGVASRIAQESGGNPYFVLELARYSTRPRGASSEPPGLEDVLRDRIRELPAESRSLLEVVAVHGQPLTQADAYRAAGLNGRDPAHLAALRLSNLVRSGGANEEDEVESFHDRVRETTVQALSAAELRARHHGLADTLEVSGRAEPESLAFHFEGAGVPTKACGYYEQAGDRASTALAFDRAAGHYRRCLNLIQPTPDQESTLRTKLGEALVNSGRCVDAAHEYELAADRAALETKLDLERRAAFHYTASGRLEEGSAIFERVLGRVGLHVPASPMATLFSILSHSLRIRLQGTHFLQREPGSVPRLMLDKFDAAWSVAAPMGMMNTAQGMNFGTLALLLAMKAGDPVRFVYGLQVAAYSLALEGENGRKRALSLIKEARGIVAKRDDARLQATLLFTEAAVAYVQADWPKCWGLLEQAEEIFAKRTHGAHWELASIRTLELYSLQTLGRFADLRERCGPFLQEAEELGDLYSCANVETFCEPMAQLAAGRPDLAQSCVTSGLQRWAASGYHLQNAMAAHATSWIAFYEGRAAQNLDFVEQQWALMHANHIDRFDNMRVAWLDFRFRTALAAATSTGTSAQQKRRATEIVHKTRKALGRETTTWGRASAAVAEAAMALTNGAPTSAGESLHRAAAGFESLHMMGYAWSAKRHAGELSADEQGRQLVAAADRWFDSQSVVSPDRMAAMHVAGFNDSTRTGERMP